VYKEIKKLVELSRKGDVKAKEELLRRLHPLVIASIRRYYNKVQEYDDLIQDGYEIILKCLQDYDAKKDVHFLGYVKTMLRYCYLNKHRQKQLLSLNEPVMGGEIGDFIPDDRDEIGQIIEYEDRMNLYKGLNLLTDKQKQIIIDFYVHKLSISQIAEKMDISYRTVVNIKSSAIKKLKSSMVK